jgi:hypothetical protein
LWEIQTVPSLSSHISAFIGRSIAGVGSIFASIDHSGEAEKVGMKMNPTRLIIFGSPKGGTPAMIAGTVSGTV